MNINDYFKRIYCINLKDREDRWIQVKSEIDKINLSGIIRFDAIKDKVGIRGCTRSHIELIKLAKKEKLENILIFEDDFRILDESTFYDNLYKSLSELPENWDMFYLGANLMGDHNIKMSDNLIKIGSAKTTHAYAIKLKVFDAILNKFESIDWNNGNLWKFKNPNRMNIDAFYSRDIHPNFNIYGTYPCLCDQREGYSDIINKNTDYKNIRLKYGKL